MDLKEIIKSCERWERRQTSSFFNATAREQQDVIDTLYAHLVSKMPEPQPQKK